MPFIALALPGMGATYLSTQMLRNAYRMARDPATQMYLQVLKTLVHTLSGNLRNCNYDEISPVEVSNALNAICVFSLAAH